MSGDDASGEESRLDCGYAPVDAGEFDQLTAQLGRNGGDPNGPDRALWPTIQEAPESVLELGDVTVVTSRPAARAVDFWLRREG